MAQQHVIRIPDVLASSVDSIESLLVLLHELPTQRAIVLTMDQVRFIFPHGTAFLLSICRYLAHLAGGPVRITGLESKVHAYLRRVDFFERVASWAYTVDKFDKMDDLSRSAASPNVLELTAITTSRDVYEVGRRARLILNNWLIEASYDIDHIVIMLAEACSNVVDHSCDTGHVIIQKYSYSSHAVVRLAIADLGISIRGSLRAAYPHLDDTCSGYIQRALEGLSARRGPRGGEGLGAIARIVASNGGSLDIRSETGLLQIQGDGHSVLHDNLAFFPGTQVAITFRSQS